MILRFPQYIQHYYNTSFNQSPNLHTFLHIQVNIEFFGEIKHYPSAKEIKEHMINVLENFGYDWNNL